MAAFSSFFLGDAATLLLPSSLKLTVTLMMTGTGTPFSMVGVYAHCFTAFTAASSSMGIPRSTLTSATRPCGLMVASRITVPWTRARLAISG